MPCSPLTMIPRSVSCLTSTSNIGRRSLVRIPRLLRQAQSRTPAYSTQQPPTPQTSNPPNYKAAVICAVVALAATWATTPQTPERLDPLPLNKNQTVDALSNSTVRVEVTDEEQGPDSDQIPTGTSTVPYFPHSIWLLRSGGASEEGKSPALPAGIGAAQEEEEYQLLGLGIRKVSFLKIQVYVVGLYVAKSDMGLLQETLIRASVGSGASTLVQGEKEKLKEKLLDGEHSTKVWSEVLKDGGLRTAVRIVPTRNTNFTHMRDGWVRAIDLRAKGKEFEGEDFKTAVDHFKAMLGGRGSVAKGKVLLLERGSNGTLRAWLEKEAEEEAESKRSRQKRKGEQMTLLGTIADERISRLVWMGYLAGQHIASEDARRSVVDGVMEMVGRPMGTIETRVE